MQEDENKLYSIGEFASKAGVTLRTLRYYDKIDLLKPSKYKESGHRLYSKFDFARLQKILTLKFIGLSLDEIKEVMRYDINNEDFKKSLEIQRNVLDEKIHHMHLVVNAINDTLNIIDRDKSVNWNNFIHIINVLNLDKKWLEQYQNASNLRARIKIHELYSTNTYGWMRWYFERMCFKENAKVLELGCGDGSLWLKNIDRIPKSLDITLTDFSQGMLKDAKKTLGVNSKRFNFKQVDAQDIPFYDESFDVVIANHMLNQVNDVDKVLAEIHRVLKKDGIIYASTVGKNHMLEMRNIIDEAGLDFISNKGWELTEAFQLENGMNKLVKWFNNVKIERYEDSLSVTEVSPIMDYIFSVPGNVKENISTNKINELNRFINDKLKSSGEIHITKDTGFFSGIKK